MTEERAAEIICQRGWTLATFDGLVHVLHGGLPIGVGATTTEAVDATLQRLAL